MKSLIQAKFEEHKNLNSVLNGRNFFRQKIVNKNKEDKKLKKEFETWKKQAKEKITKLKHGELTEDEVYEWLQENK